MKLRHGPVNSFFYYVSGQLDIYIICMHLKELPLLSVHHVTSWILGLNWESLVTNHDLSTDKWRRMSHMRMRFIDNAIGSFLIMLVKLPRIQLPVLKLHTGWDVFSHVDLQRKIIKQEEKYAEKDREIKWTKVWPEMKAIAHWKDKEKGCLNVRLWLDKHRAVVWGFFFPKPMFD